MDIWGTSGGCCLALLAPEVAASGDTHVFACAGLVLGHALFNLNGPVLESADACCAGQDPGLVEDASPGSPNRQVEPSGHCSERGCSGAPPLSDNYSNGITRSNSGKTLVEHPEDLNVQSCSSHAES